MFYFAFKSINEFTQERPEFVKLRELPLSRYYSMQQRPYSSQPTDPTQASLAYDEEHYDSVWCHDMTRWYESVSFF